MEKKLELCFNNIETFHHIRCTKCKKEDYIMGGDEWDAAELFIKEGWYPTENNCYCPDCQNKRKKNNVF